ncbi:MAG: CehA/McbA family metallohydrolase [Ignavibacteriales bacterium]|nr:CehA/McbA family metallohydrolase [Ignavibacteriales bacterium]
MNAQSTYNIYFGDNHSHSWYSDGNQDQNKTTYTNPVARSITWARTNRSSLDFMGISDHNHNESLNMTLAYWRSGVREADSVNIDGNFVGLYGQEWGTIGGGGHVLIYGTDKLFGWNPGVYDVYVAKSDYARLWDSVKKYNGYCYLAHPNTSDFGSIATTAYNPKVDSVVRGVAMKSGNAFSTNTSETDPDAGDNTTYFNTLLAKGYHVAPIANQDNHNTTFGKSNQQRTVVLAASLTKANVDDAFRQRRVYASEDHNLQVRFEVNAHQMGEIFSMSGSIPFRIKVTDPDIESISKIELRYGVPGSGTAPTVLSSVLNRDSLVLSQSQAAGTTHYYYVYVQEADGNEAWSAPMWITITTGPVPGSFNLLSPSNSSVNQPLSGTLSWQTASGATSYDVYLATTNPPATKVGADLVTTSYNYSGLVNGTTYYWKVVAKNSNGSTDATASPWNFSTVLAPPSAFNLLTPSNGSVNIPTSGTVTWQSSVNATGYDVYIGTTNPPTTKVSSNQPGTNYSYSGLSNSTVYYWKVVSRNSVDTVIATGSPWNFTTIISPPGTFSLVSPPDSSINLPITGTLSWQASANASSYDVYLGTTNPPTVKVSADQIGTSYNYNGLSNNTTYFWKVVAKNVAGTLDAVGSPRRFKTIVALPGSFAHLSPSNLAINQNITGTLSWQASSNASAYDVYLDTINPPVQKVSADQATTSLNYSGLMNNKNYYWKIVSKNIAGTTDASASPWSFTTIIDTPSTFLLLAPANLTINQSIDGMLSWQVSTNAATYDVYLDINNPPLIKVSSDQATTSFNYSGLTNNTVYFWKVIAKNIGGEMIASGSPWTFTTIVATPNEFNLVAPVNDALNVSIDGVLSWHRATNAQSYDVYLDTLNPPINVVSSNQVDTTFSYTNLSNNTVYYWKIVAKNVNGTTEGLFTPWKFTTIISQPSAFQLIAPDDHAGDQLLSGILSWELSSNAELYDIYLDTLNPPIIRIDSNILGTTYLYSNLQGGKQYYWSVVAKNIAGTRNASNNSRSFVTIAVPHAPSALFLSSVLDSHVEIFWHDNATNESGYRVYRSASASGPFEQVDLDLPANSISFYDSGVLPNHPYYYHIVPFNLIGEGSMASIAATTLARKPDSPNISSVSFSSIKIILDPTSNPPNTEFAVKVKVGVNENYLQHDGSLGSIIQWNDFAAWHDTTGVLLDSLSSCESYTVSVKARNIENVETNWSDTITGTISCYGIDKELNAGWNLISVPIISSDPRRSVLFPNSTSFAFSFNGGYVQCDTLLNGYGYWLKFEIPSTFRFSGTPVDKETINVLQGWNLIGGGSVDIPTVSLRTEPENLLSNNVYGFDGSYRQVDTLKPGSGYWVKANGAGKLFFNSSQAVMKSAPVMEKFESRNKIEIRFDDNHGNQECLSIVDGSISEDQFETTALPPIPPSGAFDVRFKSHSSLETFENSTEKQFSLLVQLSYYPVMISTTTDVSGIDLFLFDGRQEKRLFSGNSLTIDEPVSSLSLIIRSKIISEQTKYFELSQNYPNPFNPSTKIQYKLPSLSKVKINVHDLQGREVATLCDAVKESGIYDIDWRPELSSGIYYCRITAVDLRDPNNSFQKTIKLAFMK